MTIAEQLDGRLLESFNGHVAYNAQTRTYTFEDGSKATALSRFKEVDPYIVGVVTVSKVEIKYWKKKL
jgi:hypothetical protein